MIKKAVLLTLLAPFLMVFSDYSFAWSPRQLGSYSVSTSSLTRLQDYGINFAISRSLAYRVDSEENRHGIMQYYFFTKSPSELTQDDFDNYDVLGVSFTDEQCKDSDGELVSMPSETYNYLSTGGSIRTNGGACSVSSTGGVSGCNSDGVCLVTVDSVTTNEKAAFDVGISGGLGGQLTNGTFSVVDFSGNDYLTELPGGCSDNSSCVAIGDKSYLVDWDSAPDYFEYVGSDGNTYSKPSSGGGSGGDTGGGDPTDPTNPTDPTTQAVTMAAILVVIPAAVMAVTIPAMVPAVPRVAVVVLVAALPYRILSLTNPALLSYRLRWPIQPQRYQCPV